MVSALERFHCTALLGSQHLAVSSHSWNVMMLITVIHAHIAYKCLYWVSHYSESLQATSLPDKWITIAYYTQQERINKISPPAREYSLAGGEILFMRS